MERQTMGNSKEVSKNLRPAYWVDTERQAIGRGLENTETAEHLASSLKETDWLDEHSRKVFLMWQRLLHEGKKTDLINTNEYCSKYTDIAPDQLAGLMDQVYSTESIQRIILKIRQHGIWQEVRNIHKKLGEFLMDYKDPIDMLEFMELSINAIDDENIKFAQGFSEKDDYEDYISILNKRKDGSIVDITTGLKDFDKIVTGFSKGDFAVIAGRPSMGKTDLMISLAVDMKKRGTKVGIISLEMNKTQLWDRIMSAYFSTNKRKFKEEISKAEIDRITSDYNIDYGLSIDDSPKKNYLDIRQAVRKMVRMNDVEIVFIDYIQLVGGSKQKQTDTEIVSEVSAQLKNVAKDFKIPIVALSQLNREVEKRKDRRPQLSDLKQSGSIEQDADQAILIYRPAYYKIEDYNGEETDNKLWLIVGKNRNGSTGEVLLSYNPSCTKIHDIGIYEKINKAPY